MRTRRESRRAIEWIENNNTIASYKKFRAIVLAKEKQNIDSFQMNISGKAILPTDSVDLLSITIDNISNSEKHISSLCRKAAGQLNALKRLARYIPQNSGYVLADAFISSNLNYCPLIWYFSTAKQLAKIEKIQERVLRFVANNFNSDFSVLHNQSGQVTMEVKRMRYSCIEIYKTLNGFNPSYKNERCHCTLSEDPMTYQFPE